MAIIQCVECGKAISDRSDVCIGCGAPTQLSLFSESTDTLDCRNYDDEIRNDEEVDKGENTIDVDENLDSICFEEADFPKEGAHNFRCGHCGASHAKDFIFCGACGLKGTSESAHKASSHKKCLECGFSNSNVSKYCFNCGLSLEGEPFKQVDRKPWWDQVRVEAAGWWGKFREVSSGWKLSFRPWWKNFSYSKFAIGSSSFVMGVMIHFLKNTVAIVFLYIPLTIAFIFGMTWLTGSWHIFSDDWGRSSGQFDVLEVRGTGSPSRDQYDVTLRNFSSRRITVFTYLQTSDGYQFCPTEHILRPNSTTIDTVRCRLFGSINNERYEIYATSNLPSELARQLRSGRNIGRIEGFR